MKPTLIAAVLLSAATAGFADANLPRETVGRHVAAAAADSAVAAVRAQFLGYYTAAGADARTPRMRDALATLDWHARSLTQPGFLLSDGSWSDINYQETPAGNWGPWDHSRRLIVMAKAYQTPGQSLYKDRRLREQIDAALAYTKNFYGAAVIPTGNWWFWTIGIPLDLGPTLVLMRGEVDQKTFDDLVFAMHLRIGSSPAAKGLVGPRPTGQNLVWSAFTHLCLALLKDDVAMLGLFFDSSAVASVAPRHRAGEAGKRRCEGVAYGDDRRTRDGLRGAMDRESRPHTH